MGEVATIRKHNKFCHVTDAARIRLRSIHFFFPLGYFENLKTRLFSGKISDVAHFFHQKFVRSFFGPMKSDLPILLLLLLLLTFPLP